MYSRIFSVICNARNYGYAVNETNHRRTSNVKHHYSHIIIYIITRIDVLCIGSFIIMISHVYLRRIFQTTAATKSKLPQLHPVSVIAVRCDHPRTNRVIGPSASSRTMMMSNHGARKGLHLQNLAEMANQKEHDAAVARREKKKEKTAIRKGGKKVGVAAAAEDMNDEFDEYDAKSKNKAQVNDDDWDELENDDDDDDEEFDDAVVLPNPSEAKTKMMTHVENFRNYLKSIRGGGQPSVEMFDDVMVRDAYGVATGDVSVKALAQIVMVSPTLANATCFDPATTKAVVIAIRDTLELNPQAEEGTGAIKIPIPRISMEVRQQLISTIHKRAENYRVRIRNHRRKVLDVVKRGVAGRLEGVSKDDAFRIQQEIEAMTDTVIKELNKLSEKKESEIMSVQ